MLSESEKEKIEYALKTGLSYQEIAQDLFLWRYYFTVIDLRNEIETYAKGEK